jgi:hypothetical protein
MDGYMILSLARFLSPDPFVHAPDYSQSFNRYSYTFNNPLKFTDPSGEIPLVAALAYIAMQGIIAGDMARDTEMGFWGGFALGVGTAILSNFVNAVVGPVMSGSGILAGVVNNVTHAAITGAISYGATALISGQPFFWQGYATNIAMAAFMGAVTGGIDSHREGLKIFSGKPKEMEAVAPDRPAFPEKEQPIKIKTDGLRSEIDPIQTGSYLEYDGEVIQLVDEYSDGSAITNENVTLAASSGDPRLDQYTTNGRIPNGEWDLVNMNWDQGGKSYELHGVKFFGDLEPRFDVGHRDGFEIHPDGGTPQRTNGCIGLNGTRQQLIDFYNETYRYIQRHGPMRVNVNY